MASPISTPPRIRRTHNDDPDPTTPILPSLAALHVSDVVGRNTIVLPPCRSLEDAIISASTHVWDVPVLRTMQMEAISHILNHRTPNKLLLVARTGVGKTHVTRTVGVILRGIILIIIPLLSLSADQLRKFRSACQSFGSVVVYHLDEIMNAPRSLRDKLLDRLSELQNNTTSTVFLFVSPQFLMKQESFRHALISQARRGVLRLIKLDEVHLHVQHGVSFRRDIRMLKDFFFLPIFTTNPERAARPFVFCCTATMSQEYISLLATLTSVGFPSTAQIWSTHEDFQQRTIGMTYYTSSEYIKKGLNQVVDFFLNNPGRCACVFVNSRGLSHKIVVELEKKLDNNNLQLDVIRIPGQLDRFEKFYFTRIFYSYLVVSEFSADTLVGMSAINVGLDNEHVDFVLQIGWSRDLHTFFQEKGRCSRVFSALSICLVLGVKLD